MPPVAVARVLDRREANSAGAPTGARLPGGAAMALLPLPQYIPVAGPFGVSGFSIAAAAGIAAGRLLLGRLLRARPDVRAEAVEVILPALVGALLLGRLANQVVVPDLRWHQPLTWFAASGTSLSYAGALPGAGLAVWWSLRGRPWARRLAVFDALAPAAALAVAVGWLGVPALGNPTAVFRAPLYGGIGVQPIQLYGAFGFAAIAAWLVWAYGRSDFPGQNLVTFVALMSAFRFVLGFLVPAPPLVPPWSAAQAADAVLALLGMGASLLLQRSARTDGAPGSDSAAVDGDAP